MHDDLTRRAGMAADMQARRVAVQHRLGRQADQYVTVITPADDNERLFDLRLQVDRIEEAVGSGTDPQGPIVSAGGCIQAWLEAIAAGEAR